MKEINLPMVFQLESGRNVVYTLSLKSLILKKKFFNVYLFLRECEWERVE